jgi:predicted transcriptional regulator
MALGDPAGNSATVAEFAAELGVSERTARNRLALVDAPEVVKDKVRSGVLRS